MTEPFSGPFRPPLRRRAILVALAAALIAGIAWYLGLDAGHAIGVGGALFGLGIVGISLPSREPVDRTASSETAPQGHRWDVAELSWSLHARTGRVGAHAFDRVRKLAMRRLAREKLTLGDPADQAGIEQLIGVRAYSALRPNVRRLPTLRTLLHCLDMLDRLEHQHRTKEKP